MFIWTASPRQHSAQDFKRKTARGYPHNTYRMKRNMFMQVDEHATEDCTLMEFPDLD